MNKRQFIKKYGYHAYKLLKNKENRDLFLSTVSQRNIHVQAIGFFKSILNMIKDIFTLKYKLRPISIISLIFSIIYIVVPTDVILDVVPIIGLIDDITIILFLSAPIVSEYRKYITFKQTFEEAKKYYIAN